jgi:hypothetical protein
MRAREGSRSIYLLRTRAGLVALRTRVNILDSVRLALPRFPRIWIRSIGLCEKGVKRKTRHVVDFFGPCLFVVVVLRRQLFCFLSPRGKFTWKIVVEMREENLVQTVHRVPANQRLLRVFSEMIFSHSIRRFRKALRTPKMLPRI